MGITKEAIGLAATQQAAQPIDEREQPPSQLPTIAFNTLLGINNAIDTAQAALIASKVSAEARLAKDQQDFKRKVDGLITPKMRALSFMSPQTAGVISAADTKVEYFAREQELQHQKIRESIFEHDRQMLRSNYGSTEEYRAAIDPIEKDYFGDYEPSPEYKVRKEAEYKTLDMYYNLTTEGEKRVAKIDYKHVKVKDARNAVGLSHVPLEDAVTRLWTTIKEETRDTALAYEAVKDLLSTHSDTQGVERILGSLTYFSQEQKQEIMAGSRNAKNQARGFADADRYTAITASRAANNSGRYYEGGPTGDPETDRRNALFKTSSMKGPPHQVEKDLKEGRLPGMPMSEVRRYAIDYADKAHNRLEELVDEQKILPPAQMMEWSAPTTSMRRDKTTGSIVGEEANKVDHKRVAMWGSAILASQGFAPEIEDTYTSAQTQQNLAEFQAHKDEPVLQRIMMDHIWEAVEGENKKYSAVFPQGIRDPGHVLGKNTGSPYATTYVMSEHIKKGEGGAIFDQLSRLEKAPGNTLAEDISAATLHLQNKDKPISSFSFREMGRVERKKMDLDHYRKTNPGILDAVVKTTVAKTTIANGGKTAFHEKARAPDDLEAYIAKQMDDSFDFYTGYSPTGKGVPLIIPKGDKDLIKRFEIQIKNTNIPVLGNLHDVFNDPKTSKYAYLAMHKENPKLAEIWVAPGKTLEEIKHNAERGVYKLYGHADKKGVLRPHLIDGSSGGLFQERGAVQNK